MTIMYEAIKSNLRAEQKCGRVHNWQVEKEIIIRLLMKKW